MKIKNHPKDFNQLALTEGLGFGNSIGIAYFNKEGSYLLDIDGVMAGPFTRTQLEILVHVSKDALDKSK